MVIIVFPINNIISVNDRDSFVNQDNVIFHHLK